MPRTDDVIKAKLKEEGRWEEFVLRRRTLRLSGRSSEEAHKEALAEFCDPEHVPVRAEKGANPIVFKGRGSKASFIDQAIWVAQNMDNIDPKRTECPDPAAWSMLMACHESPTFKTSFWTHIYVKVMLAQMKADESRQDDDSDRGLCDLCAELDSALDEDGG